jgi:hypothetical protein
MDKEIYIESARTLWLQLFEDKLSWEGRSHRMTLISVHDLPDLSRYAYTGLCSLNLLLEWAAYDRSRQHTVIKKTE